MYRYLACLLTAIGVAGAAHGQDDLRASAEDALHRAVEFYRNTVSCEGGYLWRYSADLEWREGEGRASKTTVWVQPPGTPSIGAAYLDAYEATGDTYYLDAAVETAQALVRGQLQSGGWDYRIEFAPEDRAKYAYRVDDRTEGRNVTTLDDNTTQSALAFLMKTDRALDFKNAAIHEAVEYALDKLLAAQYPNGAWPQRFSAPPDPEKFPVKPASYPESWPREYPGVDYKDFYTFNDNTIRDMILTFMLAYEVYGDEAYRTAVEEGGDFLLLAQMPEPQPAWAQQYDHDMHPAWARRFEPPAVVGSESQGVLETLLDVYRFTGDKKYLEPVPRALEYLKSSLLPDGRLPRFRELQTNRPLYFTKDYELTYSSDDMPTHYAFIGSSRLDDIERRYRTLVETDDAKKNAADDAGSTPSADAVRAVIEGLDERGAWVEDGTMRYHENSPVRRIIDSRTFAPNVRLLSRYLERTG